MKDALNQKQPDTVNGNATAQPLPRLAYTLRESAAILGVSYITAHRLLKRGLLRSSSALRTKIISRDELERFLRETTITN